MNPSVPKPNARQRRSHQHLAARLVVPRILHCTHQILRRQFDGLRCPDLADRIGTLVGRTQLGLVGRSTLGVRQRSQRFQGMAQNIQPRAGRHQPGQGARVVRVDDPQQRTQRTMRDPRLGMHGLVVEDRHPRRLAARPSRGGHRNQRLQLARHRPPLADRRVDIGQKLCWIGGIQVGRLGRVDAGSPSHRNIAVKFSIHSKLDGLQKRGIGRLNPAAVVKHPIHPLSPQRIQHHRHSFAHGQVGVGHHHDPPDPQLDDVFAHLTGRSSPKFDAGTLHRKNCFKTHAACHLSHLLIGLPTFCPVAPSPSLGPSKKTPPITASPGTIDAT